MKGLFTRIASFFKSDKVDNSRDKFLFENLSENDRNLVISQFPHESYIKLVEGAYIISVDYANSFVAIKKQEPVYKIILLVGCSNHINLNMQIVNKLFKNDPIYTNINVMSNRNTESILSLNSIHKLPLMIDSIVKRLFVFKTTKVSKPENRIYCNRNYINGVLNQKGLSKHTKNIIKEYLDSI